MLHPEEALARLLAAARPLPVETVPLQEAVGRVAAEDLAASHPLPRFPQAAMDGYVCHGQDVAPAGPDRPVPLRVTGHAPAGHAPGAGPQPGEAWAIATGAALPARGDRVLPLENVRRIAPDMIEAVRVDAKDHVIRPGELLQAGAPIIRAGRPVPAAALAAAAAAGIDRVRVYRRPRVALLATGDEVVGVGRGGPLPPGRIYNATGTAIRADLQAAGHRVDDHGIVGDDPEALRAALDRALASGCDVIVTSGGVSVGLRDQVHRTWLSLGVRRVVGRINLKPGGPFFAGVAGSTWVVGLSGSPTAALATHHLLLRPLLARLAGLDRPVRPVQPVRLAAPAAAAGSRPRVLWSRLRSSPWTIPEAEPLTPHPHGALAGLAAADALVLLDAGTPALAPGTMVPALLLGLPESREDLRCRPPLPLVVGLVGQSGSGKTLVAHGLCRRLAGWGLRVAAVKHAAHGFDLDRPGSDSARMAEAGAGVVVITGPGETALRLPLPPAGGPPGPSPAPGPEPPGVESAAGLAAAAAVQHLGEPPQVILVEGFQHPHRPVIVLEPARTGPPAGQVLARIDIRDLDDRSLSGLLDRLALKVRELLRP